MGSKKGKMVIDSKEREDFYYMDVNVPCQSACPADTNIPAYIRCLFEEHYCSSYEIICCKVFAGDPEGIINALIEGIHHKGFSFFHIYTPCVTFDKQFKTWSNLKQWVHPLPHPYDPTDL